MDNLRWNLGNWLDTFNKHGNKPDEDIYRVMLTAFFLRALSEVPVSYGNMFKDEPENVGFNALVKHVDCERFGDKMQEVYQLTLDNLAGGADNRIILNELYDFVDFSDSRPFNSSIELRDEKLNSLVQLISSCNFEVDEWRNILINLYHSIYMNLCANGQRVFFNTVPIEVYDLMSRLAAVSINSKNSPIKTYNPAIGSGALVSTLTRYLSVNNLSIYGEDSDKDNLALAKMNLLLHDLRNCLMDIETNKSMLESNISHVAAPDGYDLIVSHPPNSNETWYHEDIMKRFRKFGRPHLESSELVFILHILLRLKEGGKAVVLASERSLKIGPRNAHVRRSIIGRNVIKSIIKLPENMQTGYVQDYCLIIICNTNSNNYISDSVQFIDASNFSVQVNERHSGLDSERFDELIGMIQNEDSIPGVSRMISDFELRKKEYSFMVGDYRL